MSDSVITRLSIDGGASYESILVTELNSGKYRLEETPIFSESTLSFGDVIEAEEDETGCLLFSRIVSKAEYQTQQWVISQQIQDSLEFKNFCDSVLKLGGMWELAFGGFFIVHMPLNTNFDLKAEIEKISQIVDSRL